MTFSFREFEISPYIFFVLSGIIIGLTLSNIIMRKKGVAKLSCFLASFLVTVSIFTFTFTGTFKGIDDLSTIGFDGIYASAGLVLGAFMSSMIFREDKERIMSSFICTAPLMYSVAKIGCFLVGCCRGFGYDGPFCVSYEALGEASFFPVQLLDSVSFMLLFLTGLILVIRCKDLMRVTVIIIFAGISLRFISDFLRISHEGCILSRTQIILLFAIIVVIIATGVIFYTGRKDGKEKEHE